MARHSHWHNIQLTKGKADAKRAASFGKLARAITLAARTAGGDPTFNVALRVAIDAARAVNMPKDNVDRAVKRGTGEGEDATTIEEVLYEGFGPGGAALLVQCLTDNRNRSLTDVRTVMSKNGGTLGNPGSVKWMFEKKGVVIISPLPEGGSRGEGGRLDEVELDLIESGADDIHPLDGMVEILTSPTSLKATLDALDRQHITVASAGLEYRAKELVAIDASAQPLLDHLVELLEDLDDVDAVYTNEA